MLPTFLVVSEAHVNHLNHYQNEMHFQLVAISKWPTSQYECEEYLGLGAPPT